MPTKVKISDLTRESLILQKKVMLIYYLTGLTQNDFCKELGVAKSYLSELKRIGRVYDPRYSFLTKLAHHFRVEINWLCNPALLPCEFFSPNKAPQDLLDNSKYYELVGKLQDLETKERNSLSFLENVLNISENDRGGDWEDRVTQLVKEFFLPININ